MKVSRSAAGAMLAAGAAAFLTTLPARAEHFDMLMGLRGKGVYAESSWDTLPPEAGRNQRPKITVGAGDDLTLEWRARSEYPHGVMKSVTVRLILVRLAGATVEEIPPDAPRLFDNTITCDFLPKHSARGILQFRIPDPGSYRLRLESEGTRPEHDHDHFSAMDVLVE